MSVVLRKTGIDDCTLPFPAHSKTIETDPNQTAHKSAGGTTYTVKHGPTRYRVSRKWEALSDAEADALMAFFEASGGLFAEITYRYTPAGGSLKAVPCQIAEPPRLTEIHRDNWDAEVVFEQPTPPNRESDPAG